jgi:hypothetical protein
MHLHWLFTAAETPTSRWQGFLETMTVAKLVNKFSTFMKPEGSVTFTTASFNLALSYMNPVNSFTPYFFPTYVLGL